MRFKVYLYPEHPVNPWPRPGLANLVVGIKFLKIQYQYTIISVRRARAGLSKKLSQKYSSLCSKSCAKLDFVRRIILLDIPEIYQLLIR